MTMRTMNAHIEGYKLRREIEDEQDWMLGSYIQSAVATAVEHVLSKHPKSKYVEKPIMMYLKEKGNLGELTDEDKKKQAEQLFLKLKIMQSNFELKKNREALEED